MKKIYQELFKSSNWVIVGVLSVIVYAISSCNALEKGSNYAEYEVKGKVLDPAGKPISGIEIKYGMSYKSMFDNHERLDTLAISRTNADGEYHVKFSAYPEHKLRIIATDIEGRGNDSFRNDTTDMIILAFEGKKKKRYEGKAVVSVPDIQLKTNVELK